MDYRLKDRVVVVTGAARGIGAEIARAFCAEGARTVFTDIDADGLRSAVKGYEERAVQITCDVSDPGSVEKLFGSVVARLGALHVLVNNAAALVAGYAEDITEAALQRTIDVNIKGYVYTTIRALPIMKKARYGRLIYINSGSGLKASEGLSLYSGSKYFERGFAIAVALEVGEYNITANSICPSDVFPQGARGAGSWQEDSLVAISLRKEGVGSLPELIEKRARRNPMGRSCTAADVAHLALFLASEQAGFINGQSIGVNGGALPY